MTRNRALERWNLLRKRYNQRGLILALGAGVSTDCNLPSWKELLYRIGDKCLGANGRDLVTKLLASGTTLPAITGILESKRPSGTAFADILRDQLYLEFPFRTVINTPGKRQHLVTFIQTSNPTMRSVAAFCARTDSDGKFAPNEMIRAVVNFNVDSVLRTYARARYETYLFRTIESASKQGKLGRIPIYQMHGFLKFYTSNRVDDDEEVRCVFTEGEYFDFFNRPNSVFNYTFLYLLREFNCLFIGMSMTDENIRRLLHYSTAERRERARERGEGSSDQIALRHFAILKKSGSDKLDALTDISLRRLGTRALWISDFLEIPQRLAFIRGDEPWKDVY